MAESTERVLTLAMIWLFPNGRSGADVDAQFTFFLSTFRRVSCAKKPSQPLVAWSALSRRSTFGPPSFAPVCALSLSRVCVFSIPENISGEILKAVQSIYPMQNVYIRKVKALKKPKFDRE